jgi:hypothetical protein
MTSLITSGLGANSSLMKSDAVEALSIVIAKYHAHIDPHFITNLNQILILLLKDQNKEITRAILNFQKVKSNQIKLINI